METKEKFKNFDGKYWDVLGFAHFIKYKLDYRIRNRCSMEQWCFVLGLYYIIYNIK